jgi:hypothetical protein
VIGHLARLRNSGAQERMSLKARLSQAVARFATLWGIFPAPRIEKEGFSLDQRVNVHLAWLMHCRKCEALWGFVVNPGRFAMMKFVFGSAVALTAALAFVAATTPAQAQAPDQNNYIENSPDSAGGSSATRMRAKRYCFVDSVTGSRIPVKVCKTRKEWEAEGVKIPLNK